jgi:hypothetical protein
MSARIPERLLIGAYFARNGEAAWPREAALKVIAWATEAQIPLLGVEVWIPSTPGPTIPTPYVYTFEPQSILDETPIKRIARANKEAAEYVASFEWDSMDNTHWGIEPFFNITFG